MADVDNALRRVLDVRESDELTRLLAENEELRAENEELRAENEELRADEVRYPEVVEMDPPAGMVCCDFHNNQLVIGNMVRNRLTGTTMTVDTIVYLGFEDRDATIEFDEPGFMLSPVNGGFVNAGDCEKIE